jgi:hypothetical protein
MLAGPEFLRLFPEKKASTMMYPLWPARSAMVS